MVDPTALSGPTVTRSLEALRELGIVEEMTGRKWRRTYAYKDYLAILNEGTPRHRDKDRSAAIVLPSPAPVPSSGGSQARPFEPAD